MNTVKTSQRTFIGFTFLWSFFFWGLGIFLAVTRKVAILENADLVSAILDGTLSKELYTITLVNTLAGYGPLLGALFVTIVKPQTRQYFKQKFRNKIQFKYILQIITLFVLITIGPILPLVFKDGLSTPFSGSLIIFLVLLLIYQFITAGTEEIGWRGYLLPSMLHERTPWEASVRIGVIWALWHTPIIFYVFYAQGIPTYQILLSFAGFIAGTIAMSTIHTYYYLKTNNIFFNMFIHEISNTLPMFVGMLFAKSYEVSVVVQLLLWVFVFLITKKNKDLFDTVQHQ